MVHVQRLPHSNQPRMSSIPSTPAPVTLTGNVDARGNAMHYAQGTWVRSPIVTQGLFPSQMRALPFETAVLPTLGGV